jgi:hypothetical protein
VRLWIWAWTFAKWDCKSCGAKLGFNVGRRFVVALVASPFTAVALILASKKDWLLSVLILAIGLMLWRFDSLRLVAPNEEEVAGARTH